MDGAISLISVLFRSDILPHAYKCFGDNLGIKLAQIRLAYQITVDCVLHTDLYRIIYRSDCMDGTFSVLFRSDVVPDAYRYFGLSLA